MNDASVKAASVRRARDAPRLSLEAIDRLITAYDDRREILALRVGRYAAWAACRSAVRWRLVSRDLGFNLDGAAAGSRAAAHRHPRLAFGAAAGDITRNARALFRRRLLALRFYRPVTGPDGRVRDSVYDDLLDPAAWGGEPLILDFDWPGMPGGGALPTRGQLRAAPYRALISRTARRLRAEAHIAAVARELAARLGNLDGALPGGLDVEWLANCLRRFEAARRVYGGLLRLLRPSVLLLTNGPGRVGELAAARDAEVPAVELQHGTWGPRDAGVHWGDLAARQRDAIPAPDRLLVYGELWRAFLVGGAFWRPEQVVAVGAGGVDRYRRLSREKPAEHGAPVRVLFPTQQIGVAESLDFWERFFELARHAPRLSVELVLKLHPLEAADATPYAALQARWRDRVRLVGPEVGTLGCILDADIVAGHHSTCQMEALALGVPAISICNATVPNGLAGMHERRWLEELVPHVRDPESLAALLENVSRRDTGALAAWTARVREAAKELYTPGFLQNARNAIEPLLHDASGRGR
jgi:hypothetical protein